MFRRNAFLAAVVATPFYCAPFASGAQTEDAAIGKDLKVTIALHGHTCNAVIDVKRNGDSDYLASCQDGNRYRVFVDAEGRVVVQKQ